MTPPRYLFDRWGTCFGHVDGEGRYYDAQGRELGRVGTAGEIYDGAGAYRGRIDVQGQYWDQDGVRIGYLGPLIQGAVRPSSAKTTR